MTSITERIMIDNAGVAVHLGYECRIVLTDLKKRFHRQKIGYPKIGAGLAGGDWEKIKMIIDEELAGENHTLVEYVG